MKSSSVNLLIKCHRSAEIGRLSFGGAERELRLTPLFDSIETAAAGPFAAEAPPAWHAAELEGDGLNPWDACHALMRDGLGFAGGGGVTFAEPDLEQSWLWSTQTALGIAASGQCGPPAPQDNDVYAIGPSDRWFADKSFSQLDDARKKVSGRTRGGTVRIAHLDTGYDPEHVSRPEHLAPDGQHRDFTVQPPKVGAVDPGAGGLNSNPGHGVATLALLAGRYADKTPLGGGADLEVLPLRVAKGVVLFKNSAIARALDYVHGLADDPATRIDVVSMSMGGLASAAWADAVNALYERGIVIVTAAGNNFGNLPTRYIVYPARFNRVIAACGIMADGRPYADLPFRKMAGCYGPTRKESTAMAAFTPNVPWARIGCGDLFDADGGGTSSATPQIASAAALWLQFHKDALATRYRGDDAWARVEAVREALFQTAKMPGNEPQSRWFGNGVLQAASALNVAPAEIAELRRQDRDKVSFPILRVLFGLGAAAPDEATLQMLELEAIQLTQRSPEVAELLGDLDPGELEPDSAVDTRRVLEAIADQAEASTLLKQAIFRGLPPTSGGASGVSPSRRPSDGGAAVRVPATQLRHSVPPPQHRRLRVFAFDPLMGTRLDTLHLNVTTVSVPWEQNLQPGPVGDYFEVVDVDPSVEQAYIPVDLNLPEILAQDGLSPSEGSPQFHQQMVYAVAMRTVAHFEEALGRRALWAEREPQEGDGRFEFVRRLRLYPHALRERNAFYDPVRRAILFGYFKSVARDAGDNLPGGLIFTCLSHDIVTHEVCHALLDGVHPYYREATNIDMLAFHEAFADIVALFQHFTMPEPLRHEIAKTAGDLRTADLLAALARQFGEGIGKRGVLRSAISRINKDGKLERVRPSKTDYSAHTEPHERGAVLVAAVFDAFLQIYEYRSRDLLRLATGGTGILPAGAIPHDLIERLASEAAESARQILLICIRALDYCPPVDLTFGEYLRALITADRDVVPEDDQSYRVAFISAFRARGIYPPEVANLSAGTLAWQNAEEFIGDVPDIFKDITIDWSLDADRGTAYRSASEAGRDLTDRLRATLGAKEERSLAVLGVILHGGAGDVRRTLDGVKGTVSKPRILAVRPLRRQRSDGRILNYIVVEITQRWKPDGSKSFHRGGCSIVYDADARKVRYIIRKRLGNRRRVEDELAFRQRVNLQPYFSDDEKSAQPFAMVHRGH